MNQDQNLQGKKIAILVTDGFEQSEFELPRAALEAAGAKTHLVSPKSGEVQSWSDDKFGDDFLVDVQLEEANAPEYDALLLPGGVANPDKLRANPRAVEFVRHFYKAGKPIAAICHGPQLLIEVNGVRGRRVTSYPSLRTDFENAGAQWVDEPVVTDNGVVTSRSPADIPQFIAKMIEEIGEGVHERV
jgi:protease I